MINPILTIIIPLLFGFLMPILYKILKNKAYLLLMLIYMFNIIVLLFLLPYVYDKPFMVEIAKVKPPFGIVLFFSFYSTIFSLLVNIFAFFLIFVKMNKENDFDNEKVFLTIFPIIMAASVSLINTMDIFNVFVFLEIVTISSYLLAGLKKQNNTDISVIKFITGTSIGSLLFLIGISAIYKLTGTLNILDMHQIIMNNPSFNTFYFSIGLMFLIAGMLFELYLFPGNIFVIDIYAYSSAISGAIFSGIILTAVTYIFVQIFTLLSISHIFNNMILIFAVITMLSAEFAALTSKNLKRTLGFSSFGQSGLIISLFAISNLLGNKQNDIFNLAILLIILHAFAKFTLFITLNKFINKNGRIIKGFQNFPLSVIGFILSIFLIAGIPPFPGFFVKFNIIIELLRVNYLWFVILILISAVLEILYFFRMARELFLVNEDENTNECISMIFPVSVIILLLILITFNTNKSITYMSRDYKKDVDFMKSKLIKSNYSANKNTLIDSRSIKE